ncbi:MAG: peptidoglycan DD-metalloendopeptidase family protein [Chloroflexi bacterium]|nr:peptidoglycan DD-metalloendopeptidase family protein [Ardenticatenaceae bacterium]MBL1129598.1 hypothetical protein [Chloroflexota bacterium]NOG35679.1 peptidoglycan DD-metalloendopeptidase family protein [Chloroflexota bacterium]
MNKKQLIATVCIQVTCLCIIAWMLPFNSAASVEAHFIYQEPTATPTFTPTPTPTPVPPFLGPIYYDEEYVWKIFDHEIPGDYDNDPEGRIRHYDSTLHDPPGAEYGYNGHIGIDYSLVYEPVLASANGAVVVAGWSNEANHRLGYGLHVVMSYNANPNYTTIYGHLSTLNVRAGDEIDIDPNDPGNRNRIIGISGNTGHVFNDSGNDCGPIPVSGPNCGHHLHFETRRNGVFVNPYGWISSTPDPWAQHQNGTISHYLWVNRPAVLSTQYIASGSQGTSVNDPGVNNARMIIDDGSADFSTIDTCWVYTPGNDSFNNSYHRANANGPNDCRARWTIHPDAFTLPGEYDVFVHIPEDSTASLGAVYTITHNMQTSRAIVVQAAYLDNNTEHNAWAYLGRYHFAMDTAVSEFIELYDDTLAGDAGNHVLADAIMLAPADDAMPLPQQYLYVSFASSGYAGNVPYEDEDILLFDAATGEWRMFFDGSDVGLAGVDIDAVDFRDGYLHFSLDAPLGSFTDADIIRFNPTSLGEDTSGTMSAFMPGEKLGLTPAEFPGEDVDALAFNHQGKILLSTQGQSEIGPDIFEDEDLFISDSDTSASLFFDGSDYALNEVTENVDGVWLGANGSIYLSTAGSFAVTEVSGDGADIFICAPGIFMNCWFVPGLFWNGSAHGLGSPSATVDDFFVHNNQLLEDCETFGNGGFEAEFYCWSIVLAPDPQNQYWLPTMNEAHSDLHSAMAVITSTVPDVTILRSSAIHIQSVGIEYRLSFYGKALNINEHSNVRGMVAWFNDDEYLGVTFIGVVRGIHTNWSSFTTPFGCPPAGANTAFFSFQISDGYFAEDDSISQEAVGHIFIDDAQVESRPNANCPTLNSGGN